MIMYQKLCQRMSVATIVGLLLAMVPGRAAAQLSADVLTKIKQATVLIEVVSGNGETAATGTGFVVGKSNGRNLIATNAHVIAPAINEDSTLSLRCIFNAGQLDETAVAGKLESVSVVDDLALLSGIGARDAVPLELAPDSPALETQRIFIAAHY
jgi:S1-C subfamily serine protease